jgi:hypothetical protein
MKQNYKRHLSVYNKKMQLSKDLDARLKIMEKLDKLDKEIISKHDDPSFSRAKNAAIIVNACHELQGWVARSIGKDTDEI